MPLQREAMTKANFDRQEKGLAPILSEKVTKPDVVEPDFEDMLTMSKIVVSGFEPILRSAVRKARRNDDRVLFVGYDVSIDLISTKKEDTIALIGWMIEGEFMAFVRNYRTTTDQQVINW